MPEQVRRAGLLTPEQAAVASRLHQLGLFTPDEIARMLRVPAERLARSFRADLTAAEPGVAG